MAESQFSTNGITFGQGGLVTDPRLLEVLVNTPILKPRDVMKLAIYFRASPTISHLGEVLWEKGRKSITMDQSVAQVVKQFFGLDIILFNKAFDDAIEDQFDPDPEENPE